MESEDPRFQKQLNAGATSLVLLGLLEQAGQAMYGYEIAKRLETRAGRALPMKLGALYPALRSLEKQQLLTSYVEPSTAGPARRYYRITPAGRKTLPRWLDSWRSTNLFVELALEIDDERSKRSGSAVSRRLANGTRKVRR